MANGNAVSAVQTLQEWIRGFKEDLLLSSYIRQYEQVKKGPNFFVRDFLVYWRLRVERGIQTALSVAEFFEGARFSWRISIKYCLDMLFSALGLVLSLPVMALVAVAIKLDSKGSVFFKQDRVGKEGRLFKIYKFRTMRPDAEAHTGPVWAQADDPRVTRLGRFLRKTRLDELPQLWNVLKGEMSLVGPRPERPYFVDQLEKGVNQYRERLKVKPGITGLAQVRYHYDATLRDVKNKLRYDRLYVKKLCPLLDVRVLLATVSVVLLGKGAR